MLITTILSFARGSSKFPSIIGLSPCSWGYWLLFIFSFLVTLCYTYRNIQIFKSWHHNPKYNPLENNLETSLNKEALANVPTSEEDAQKVEGHIRDIVLMSVTAGVWTGFGLGGGVFLVPMYRGLGCKPL